MSKLPTLIFVPGSWVSTDIYRRTAADLNEFHSVVIDQPTNKLRPASTDMNEDITHTRSIIESELESGNEVVLIGHSAGGLIGCLAAHGLDKKHQLTLGRSTGIIGFIGVASILPHPGKTIINMNEEFWIPKQNALAAELGPPTQTFDEIIAAFKLNEDGTMDVIGAEDIFYHDLPLDEAKSWVMKHDTQSSGLYNLTSPSDAITSYVKTFYIQATRDKAIPAFVQDEYALQTVSGNRNNILKIDSDHIPHLSHPAELAELLRDALSEIVKS